MVRVFSGAALVVAGIAAFVVAHSHAPVAGTTLSSVPRIALREKWVGAEATPSTGWSQSVYDAVRIGGWALLIFGVLLIVVGLIGYARRPAS